ncbi:hypothetical protein H0G86_004539 [Trichoderma simmonsii]|uniref:Uncharacterized protein n=1 Tax=Trichoderma simmonsii TaxID=1491479 RepID=A0A8G0PE85_9HYPO|nr:hypothetical protein H0G86_004539 [Trichoderma simmonsii]
MSSSHLSARHQQLSYYYCTTPGITAPSTGKSSQALWPRCSPIFTSPTIKVINTIGGPEVDGLQVAVIIAQGEKPRWRQCLQVHLQAYWIQQVGKRSVVVLPKHVGKL